MHISASKEGSLDSSDHRQWRFDTFTVLSLLEKRRKLQGINRAAGSVEERPEVAFNERLSLKIFK